MSSTESNCNCKNNNDMLTNRINKIAKISGICINCFDKLNIMNNMNNYDLTIGVARIYKPFPHYYDKYLCIDCNFINNKSNCNSSCNSSLKFVNNKEENKEDYKYNIDNLFNGC